MTDFFSHLEMASLCLRDVTRTNAFRAAIQSTVRPGDVVLDAGAGSGILSFFAAAAGAGKVYAVEGNVALADRLRANADLNGFGAVIEVVCDDVRSFAAPEPVDVVVAELVDTWLLDEHQVPALNALRARGVVGDRTRVIPNRYEALITFGAVDFNCYGFKLPFPVHDWPDLAAGGAWCDLPFTPLSAQMAAFDADFRAAVAPEFEQTFRVLPTAAGVVNAARLSGVAHLCEGVWLRDTPAFNGSKLLPLADVPVRAGQPVRFRVAGRRGGGSLHIAAE